MRVLIADGQAWLRSAVRLLLEQATNVETVGEVGDAQNLFLKVKAAVPDLVLLDWELPGLRTTTPPTEFIQSLHAVHPYLQIIALSGHPEAARASLAAGADAFVSKAEPPEHLLKALQQAQQISATRKRKKSNMAEFDLVVIGGGPAGLAATSYAMHAQLNVALVTPTLGGKVSYPFALRDLPTVETVQGAELVRQFEAHVQSAPEHHIAQEVVRVSQREGGGFQLALSDQTLIGARALIICTGAHPQRLYVTGEKEFWGRGVSFSATSHASFFKDRNVAVIGNGERALVAVLKLAALANQVYFILARKRELAEIQVADSVLHHPKISIFQQWEVQEIIGDDFVTGIDLVGANGATRTLNVEGVFIEMALLPNVELVRELVALDEDGHIIVNQLCETNMPGLFGAGDVTNVHAEQVPVAIGEGAKAALSAWAYLARHG